MRFYRESVPSFRKAQANTLARMRFRKAQAPCGMTVAGCVDKKLKKRGRNKQFFCIFAPFIVRYNFY